MPAPTESGCRRRRSRRHARSSERCGSGACDGRLMRAQRDGRRLTSGVLSSDARREHELEARESGTRHNFVIGDWRVEPAVGRIVRVNVERRLRPQVMDLLLALSRRPGEIITKAELLDDVWARASSANPRSPPPSANCATPSRTSRKTRPVHSNHPQARLPPGDGCHPASEADASAPTPAAAPETSQHQRRYRITSTGASSAR